MYIRIAFFIELRLRVSRSLRSLANDMVYASVYLCVQVNGQTHARGVNLYEFADILIAHGVVSAINLDGGGSSTFLHRDVLINYPSDHW